MISYKRCHCKYDRNIPIGGFTYIELLITLAIMGILFAPVMQLFSQSLYASSITQDLITATSLARWDMERIKNLNFTKEQLMSMGDYVYPPNDEPALELNAMTWRVRREMIEDSDPLEVRVHVFREAEPATPLVSLVTLIENTYWEKITPIVQ